MIGNSWPRIAGVSFEESGDVGAVWMAYERDADLIHLYDACVVKREVLAVIAEALNARGRFIPIAWNDEALSKELLTRGCRMMYDKTEDTDAMAEIVSRTIVERMRTARFKVERRLVEWLDEAKALARVEGKVPRQGFPLMTATRLALQCLDRGRASETVASTRRNLYPKVAIV